jgi:hypothetical protein
MTMLRSILVALGAAACLFAFALLGEQTVGPIARAFSGVAMGIAVTSLVYGEATFVTVTVGAISPLVFAAAAQTSLAIAAAAMCLLWLTPRLVLAETRRRLAILATVSILAAMVAGLVFAAYVEAPWAVHAASCVFAGCCLSLVGVVVPVPSTTAFGLRMSAMVIEGPIGDVLLRAANAHESSRWQPRARAVRQKWRALVRLSDQRAALSRARGGDAEEQRRQIEQRIEAAARELAGESPGATAAADPTPQNPLGTGATTNDAPLVTSPAIADGATSASDRRAITLEETPDVP